MKAHTEEEFKKLLKSLFTEKKRVKELKRRLEESTIHKSFQGKKKEREKSDSSELLSKLEKENAVMRAQLEKVKPALRKMAEKYREQNQGKKIKQLEEQREEFLEQAYREMRELSRKNASLIEESSILEHEIEDLKEEVKRAQTYVAKKVQESTILRDLVEKQKRQIEEAFKNERKLKTVIEKLQQEQTGQVYELSE